MVAFVLLLLLGASLPAAFAQGTPAGSVLQLELYDGTRLLGPALDVGIQFSSSLGDTAVPWAQVVGVTMNTDHGDVLELAKSGRINGRVMTSVIGVSTVLGKARLPLAQIKRMTCSPPDVEVPPAAGSAPSSSNLKDGLVLHFSFDRETKGAVRDESGRDNNGQRDGGRFVADGLFRGGYEMGGQDLVQVPSSASLCPQTLTISIWIRPAQDMGDEGRMIVSKGANMSGYFLGCHPLENGHRTAFMLCGQTRGGLYTYAKTKRTFKKDTWYHLVASYDGRNQRLYVNGELEDSTDRRGPVNHLATVPLTIGMQVPPRIYGWAGTVDELRVYERALNEGEIRQLSMRTVAGVPATPAAGAARALCVEVELADRSIVKGSAAWTVLPVVHASLGTLTVPWSLIDSVSARNGGDSAVSLRTGDVLVGQMQFEKAGVDSALGRVAIARDQIRAIRVVQPGTDAAESASAGPAPGPAAAGSAPVIPPRRSVREDGATRF